MNREVNYARMAIFQCLTLEFFITKKLCERYKVDYVVAVDICSFITIRCPAIENARRLKLKLETDFIHV